MAQDWNVPPTGTTAVGTAVKTDLPNGMLSLRSLMSGTTGPSSTVAWMLFANTTSTLLQQRNSGDSAWVTVAPLGADWCDNHIMIELGAVSGSEDTFLICPRDKTIYIRRATILSDTATSSDGSNNYAFQLRNVTAANDLLATATNTNGNEIVVDTPYDITADQNQTLAIDDVLELQITETGTATALTRVSVQLDYTLSI